MNPKFHVTCIDDDDDDDDDDEDDDDDDNDADDDDDSKPFGGETLFSLCLLWPLLLS